jgi:hypothetical protein
LDCSGFDQVSHDLGQGHLRRILAISRSVEWTRIGVMGSVAMADRTGWRGAQAALAGAGLLWAGVLTLAWPRLSLFGQICTQAHQGVLDHCPLCYPAAALTAVGLGLVVRQAALRSGS